MVGAGAAALAALPRRARTTGARWAGGRGAPEIEAHAPEQARCDRRRGPRAAARRTCPPPFPRSPGTAWPDRRRETTWRPKSAMVMVLAPNHADRVPFDRACCRPRAQHARAGLEAQAAVARAPRGLVGAVDLPAQPDPPVGRGQGLGVLPARQAHPRGHAARLCRCVSRTTTTWSGAEAKISRTTLPSARYATLAMPVSRSSSRR